jgi:hypothetical protein
MLRIEEVLGKEGPEDLEAVDEILTDPDTCFAATHHIVLDALIELAAVRRSNGCSPRHRCSRAQFARRVLSALRCAGVQQGP